MDREKIIYMANIVSKMEDKDIIDFIKEYDDELSIKDTSSLITNINDNEILINYVKKVNDNIDTVFSKWNDLPDNYVGIGGKRYLSANDDNLMEQLDKVIANLDESDIEDLFSDYSNYAALYKETYKNVTTANELISHLMAVISKIEKDYEKCNMLELWFKEIEPSIISYLGQEIFDKGCKENYFEWLKQVLNNIHVVDISLLLKDNDEYLSNDEIEVLNKSLESDLLKYSLVDDYDFIDSSMIVSEEVSQDDIECEVLEMLDQINILWESKGSTSTDENLNNYISKVLDDIAEKCFNIEDDDFLEEIFEEIYDEYGILCMPIAAAIRDDDRKISLIEKNNITQFEVLVNIVASIHDDDKKISLFEEYDLATYEGYAEVLASISDEAKFKELYDKMNDGFVYGFNGFEDNDRAELIVARGDKLLAYKMLKSKYDILKSINMDDERIMNLEHVCLLMAILDEEEQIEVYNWFTEVIIPEERFILIVPIKNIEFKRQLLREMQENEKEEVSSYVKSKKLYN